MNKLRLAIIGTSKISAYALDAFSKIEAYEIVAIYSRSAENAKDFMENFNVKRVITDFEVLKNDPSIDVVYVASPNGLHFKQSLELIKAHKHVITEKPFVSSVHEFNQLMKAVKENNHFCFDAIMPPHLPNYTLIKNTLEEIKPIHLISSSQVQYSSRYNALLDGKIENIFDPKMAGGALMDLGVYPLTDIISLFGIPNDAHYIARCHENGIDLSGIITLKYDDFNAVCLIGKDAQAHNQTVFMGEKGSIVCDGSASTLRSVILEKNRESHDISIKTLDNQMIYEMQDFADVILNKNWDLYYEWLNHTENVITVMEKLRTQIGLVFPNDTSN